MFFNSTAEFHQPCRDRNCLLFGLRAVRLLQATAAAGSRNPSTAAPSDLSLSYTAKFDLNIYRADPSTDHGMDVRRSSACHSSLSSAEPVCAFRQAGAVRNARRSGNLMRCGYTSFERGRGPHDSSKGGISNHLGIMRSSATQPFSKRPLRRREISGSWRPSCA